MALMLSRRLLKSSKNQMSKSSALDLDSLTFLLSSSLPLPVTMTRAYSVNDDLPNNPVDGLPHLIMYCPKNPITFDPNSTNPNDYVLAKVPKLVQSLEWLLPSPCPVHQFDEPPVSSPPLLAIFLLSPAFPLTDYR